MVTPSARVIAVRSSDTNRVSYRDVLQKTGEDGNLQRRAVNVKVLMMSGQDDEKKEMTQIRDNFIYKGTIMKRPIPSCPRERCETQRKTSPLYIEAKCECVP
ncbi:uncharacterized protein ACNLHF_008441 isoform 1-T1 [Anomaloglossus baeobatrachus]